MFHFISKLSHEVFNLCVGVAVYVRTLECKYIHIRTLITASILTHAKEKASEAGAKHADWGVGFASEARKKNRKTLDNFAIKWSPSVIALLLTATPLQILAKL